MGDAGNVLVLLLKHLIFFADINSTKYASQYVAERDVKGRNGRPLPH